MDPKRLEELISGYLSGSLSEAEAAELAAMLRDSDEARSVAAKHLLLDRLVRGATMESIDADRVMRALGSQPSGGVADRVLDRLDREPSPRSTHRLPRRRSAPPARRIWWVSALVAASVLFLLALLSTRDSSPRVPVKLDPPLARSSPPPAPKDIAPSPSEPKVDLPKPEPRPAERPEDSQPKPPDRPPEVPPKPAPEKAPEPPVRPPDPKPPIAPSTVALTQATTIESLEGEVFLIAKTARTPVKAGDAIPDGLGVQTVGRQSRAVLRFADETRVELLGDTEIREVLEVLGARGKRFSVATGTMVALVKEQPKDKSLVIATPHAEAKVLGTTLKIVVDSSSKGSTRLEVKEGKVQFRRKSDGKAIEVVTGHHAVAATGVELVLRRTPRAPVKRPDGLPYDASCPVIYTNDGAADHLDDYLFALASAGEIELRGHMTSVAVAPFNPAVPREAAEQLWNSRMLAVQYARRSGFTRIPDPVRGPMRHLEKPPSGKIEDTRPINSVGTQLILTEARLTTPDHPVVVITGVGIVTPVADAYLLDPSIADRVVVAWSTGQTALNFGDYGSWSDPWAAYIVIQKFRTYLFPDLGKIVTVPADKLSVLPDTEYRRWMSGKMEWDGDTAAGMSLIRTDYVLRTQRMSFGRWEPNGNPSHDIPSLKDDPAGRVWVVSQLNGAAGEEEWWRALKNPAAWGRKSK